MLDGDGTRGLPGLRWTPPRGWVGVEAVRPIAIRTWLASWRRLRFEGHVLATLGRGHGEEDWGRIEMGDTEVEGGGRGA